MKKVILAFLGVTLFAFTTTGDSLTDDERKFAIEQLKNSKNHLLIALSGLSENQLNYKSSPDTWSIAECVEHIAISELTFSGMLQGILEKEADPSSREAVKVTDKQLIAMMVDRSNKVKTQKPFEPTGQFGSHNETLKTLLEKRAENIKFVKETKADFRNRVQEFPFGTVDAYQVILFMAAHSERHVRQIEEIALGANFPKN